MKFIKAKYEIWEPKECNSKNILEAIERAAKVCYKSEGNIKEGSALPFVKGIIKRGHTGVLEHGNVYIKYNPERLLDFFYETIDPIGNFLLDCTRCFNVMDSMDISKCVVIEDIAEDVTKDTIYVYTNMRFILEKCPELFWLIILDKELPSYMELFTPEENDPYRRQTVMFTTDQRITEEFLRHRVASPNKESTRYCCYSSDKHGNELTFIIPPRLSDIIKNDNDKVHKVFYGDSLRWKVNDNIIEDPAIQLLLDCYKSNEQTYNTLTTVHGWRAEEARIALNLGVKADLVLTMNLLEWNNGSNQPVDNYECDEEDGEVPVKRIKGFFGLRCDNAAHPQARELAIPLKEDFNKRNWLV